jgi:hypothetical protein
MVKNIFSLILLFGLIFSQSSCDKKVCCVNPPESALDTITNGLLIGNEGNFQWGNATLSFANFNISNPILIKDVFKQQNQKNLGDVMQSMCLWEGKIYLVINNSGKIEILNKSDLKSLGSISGFRSPRHIVPIYNTKAYVSDLYMNGIYIVDIHQKEIKGSIKIPGWTEEMLYFQNKIYVCNKESKYLYIVNTSNDVLQDSLEVGYGSSSICIDAENKIWISCAGKENTHEGRIVRINPTNNEILKTFNFTMNNAPGKIMFNVKDNKVYYQRKDIFSMEMNAMSLPANPFIYAVNKNIYSFYTSQNKTYISDAKDFVQASEISIYNNVSGLKDTSFLAGINSSSFLFLPE